MVAWGRERRLAAEMARRLRIQFAGARYHVINRGNMQHDVFATGGAVASFVRTLQAAVERFQWRLHAFVVMRNHFHLALATPEPNLVAGMHWLQSTFTVRLTRFHRQHGHVFQGRYQSLLIEDDAHLARVCDYIHLNPVRAGVHPADQIEAPGLQKGAAHVVAQGPVVDHDVVAGEPRGQLVQQPQFAVMLVAQFDVDDRRAAGVPDRQEVDERKPAARCLRFGLGRGPKGSVR